MNRQFAVAFGFSLCGLLVAAPGCDSLFVVRGQLVAADEDCLLLDSLAGQQYVFDHTAGLERGEHVLVIGQLNPNCDSICPADGCIENAIILRDRRADREIAACGTLILGAECTLFEADEGLGTFILSDLGGFAAGDRVKVEGRIQRDCVSTCMQGDGCIDVRRIEACNL